MICFKSDYMICFKVVAKLDKNYPNSIALLRYSNIVYGCAMDY